MLHQGHHIDQLPALPLHLLWLGQLICPPERADALGVLGINIERSLIEFRG